MGSLEDEGKWLLESKTVKANIVSIVATLGTVATLYQEGVPVEILWPAVATAATSIVGSLVSIFGRVVATKKIIK